MTYLNATDALAFNFQLAPFKLNNRVSRSTIIDHLSLWGAFWGVLFSIFAKATKNGLELFSELLILVSETIIPFKPMRLYFFLDSLQFEIVLFMFRF